MTPNEIFSCLHLTGPCCQDSRIILLFHETQHGHCKWAQSKVTLYHLQASCRVTWTSYFTVNILSAIIPLWRSAMAVESDHDYCKASQVIGISICTTSVLIGISDVHLDCEYRRFPCFPVSTKWINVLINYQMIFMLQLPLNTKQEPKLRITEENLYYRLVLVSI